MSEAEALLASWQARYGGATASDLQLATAAYRDLKPSLDALSKEAQIVIDKATTSKNAVRAEELRAIEARKQQAILAAMTDLAQRLSPMGWEGMRKFMKSEFRQSMKTLRIQ